ncbi:MAG TPA: response regulator [Chitinophagaceae bacterium]
MLSPLKILIVDDDQDDQAFLLEAINELYPSSQCNVVDNGGEALQYIEKNPPPPSLVFLDLNMPVVNGFEFLRDFKKKEDYKNSVVIIYTTSSHARDKEISKDLGAAEYITKISDYTKLKTVLSDVVGRICKDV